MRFLKEAANNIRYYPKDIREGARNSKIVTEADRNIHTNPDIDPDLLRAHSIFLHGGKIAFDTLLGMFGGGLAAVATVIKLQLATSPTLFNTTLFVGLFGGSMIGLSYEFAREGRHLRHTNPDKYFRRNRFS